MHFWIVKGNPRQNDLDEMLVPSKKERWVTRKPPREWTKGDGIFFWKSAPALCLVGIGSVFKVREKDDNGDAYFDVLYLTPPFERPLLIQELRADPIVGPASFLKAGAAGTVFLVSHEQARRLAELVRERHEGLNAIFDAWFEGERSTDGARGSREVAAPPKASSGPPKGHSKRDAAPVAPLTAALDAVLPSWLVRLDAPPGSRDPLGLQARAAQHADTLLPGLNVFTSRARYYSFLCWAISVAQRSATPDTQLAAVHRLERLLVLCESLRHRQDPVKTCAYVGRRRGSRYVTEYNDPVGFRLPTKVLKNQASNGAFRLYRTSLADVGLVEENEHDDGLGLTLTRRGDALAQRYGRNIDDTLVRWALDEADTRKREDGLLEAARSLCLTSGLDGHERNHLCTALFGESDHGLRRRETARLLFDHGLLAPPSDADIPSEDADGATDEEGSAAATSETSGNWSMMRSLLQMTPQHELYDLQAASAYEALALGLNRLFASILTPLEEQGRTRIREWLDAVATRAGTEFHHAPAGPWAGHEGVVALADKLLEWERPWQEVGCLATELLVTVARDERMRGLLAQETNEVLVQRVLAMGADAGTASAAEILGALIPDLVARHHEVSARKGKGEWMSLDGEDLVRVDVRPLPPLVHSLRLTQLSQLVTDLRLDPSEVADAT
jgi:hypothetical protein